MWDVLLDWGLLFAKCLSVLYISVGALGLGSAIIDKIKLGTIQAYINKKIHELEERWHGRPVTEEVALIVRDILTQIENTMGVQKNSILRHASENHSVLFHTWVNLPWHLGDPNVHLAIDRVKELFYYTYGTYLNGYHGPRHDMDIRLHTANGTDLSRLVGMRDIANTLTILDKAGYIDSPHNTGCTLRIHISIVTPRTPRDYNYMQYLH